MSIQKIAQLAGVSVATVSRVLNNSDTVKAKNRDRVLQAIKEANYQPNLLARQLRTARSYMVLVMVSNIANPFCAEVVKGIEEQAEKNGYRILLCNSGSDIERSRSGLSLLSGKMVDGIITMDAFTRLPELAALIGDAPGYSAPNTPMRVRSPVWGSTMSTPPSMWSAVWPTAGDSGLRLSTTI